MSASARMGLIGVIILLAVAVAVWNRSGGEGARGPGEGPEPDPDRMARGEFEPGVVPGRSALPGTAPRETTPEETSPSPDRGEEPGPSLPVPEPAGPSAPSGSDASPSPPATSGGSGSSRDDAPEEEPAEEVRTHRTRPGETLSGLSRRYYGREGLWRRIYEENRGVIRDPNVLPDDEVLTIPPGPEGSTGSSREESSPSRSSGGTDDASRTYVIQRGDTLYRIAHEQLGNGGRWREIYEMNRSRLDSPDDVPLGLELRLPGRETR